jgi:hypothetical protein
MIVIVKKKSRTWEKKTIGLALEWKISKKSLGYTMDFASL